MSKLLLFICLALVLMPLCSWSQTVTTTTPAFSLKSGDAAGKNITFSTDGSSVTLSKESDPGELIQYTQVSATGNTVIVKFSGTGSSLAKTQIPIKFVVDGSIDKEVKVTVSVVDPASYTFVDIKDVIQGKPKRFKVNPPVLDAARVNPTLSSGGTAGYGNDGYITFTSMAIGADSLEVKVDGITVKTFPLTVNEGVQSITKTADIILKQGEKIAVEGLPITVAGNNGSDLTAACQNEGKIEAVDGEIVAAEGGGFKASSRKVGSGAIKFTCRETSQALPLVIAALPTQVKISRKEVTLSTNDPVVIRATVYDAGGKEITGATGAVTWGVDETDAVKKDEAKALVEITNIDTNTVSVRLRSSVSELKVIRLVASSTADTTKNASIDAVTEKTLDVVDFAMLKIFLDPLDPVTAKDDFGGQITKDYFVMKATMNNVIQDKNGELFRSPILVYNQSLEAKVMIDYKDPWDGSWKAARQQQMIPNLVRTEAPTPTEDRNEGWQRIINRLNNDAPAGDYLVIPERRSANLKKCVIVEQLDYIYPIQPLKYETMLLTQESRENRGWKTRILTALMGLSSLTSFITSIAIPGAGSDLPLGLDKFNNLMIPSYQKFFPDRRELHKDHLIQEMMLPLLEIPFGSKESKYLLFPKGEQDVSIPIKRKKIDGTWDNATIKKIRITGISGSDACADVAVIRKTP